MEEDRKGRKVNKKFGVKETEKMPLKLVGNEERKTAETKKSRGEEKS